MPGIFLNWCNGKTIQYVFILRYLAYVIIKRYVIGKISQVAAGGGLTTGKMLCHDINGTMVNPALDEFFLLRSIMLEKLFSM